MEAKEDQEGTKSEDISQKLAFGPATTSKAALISSFKKHTGRKKPVML